VKLEWQQVGTVDHELIWGSLAVLAVLCSVFVPVLDLLEAAHYRCPFRAVTGVPCPTCGTTRAFIAMGSLEVGRAFRTNPLAAVFWVGLLAYGPFALTCSLLGTRRPRLTEVSERARWLLVAAGGSILAANWIYVLCYGLP
jgi:hypothetical protein